MKQLSFLILFFFLSCAKVSYIYEQGIGQVSLEYNDIDNKDFLKDPNQKSEHKEKVKIVEKAKDFFYKYFELPSTPIYGEVKILDQAAVTYLVIHATNNKIKPIRSSFPIVGSFPYLGFFKKESALKYVDEKKREGFQTFIRPVYAYSTLNHPLWPFHDNILSSFFKYSERSLTELIFHELVHTIIFVGDNVAFNENLAQFIAEQLSIEYFKNTEEELRLFKKRVAINRALNQQLVILSKELQVLYDKSKKSYTTIMNDFLETKFKSDMKNKCRELKVKNCWPLKGKWNNARFAALGTYEEKRNLIGEVYNKSNLDLKTFVHNLIKLEKNYDEDEMSFIKFMEKEL